MRALPLCRLTTSLALSGCYRQATCTGSALSIATSAQ